MNLLRRIGNGKGGVPPVPDPHLALRFRARPGGDRRPVLPVGPKPSPRFFLVVTPPAALRAAVPV